MVGDNTVKLSITLTEQKHDDVKLNRGGTRVKSAVVMELCVIHIIGPLIKDRNPE